MSASVKRHFQLLVESVTDYAICLLAPNGFVARWNAGTAKITGYAPAEILGHHLPRLFPDNDQGRGLPLKTPELARTHGRQEIEGWKIRITAATQKSSLPTRKGEIVFNPLS